MVETEKPNKQKMLLAATLLFVANKKSMSWVLGRHVKIEVQRLKLVAHPVSKKETVIFWAKARSGGGTNYGDIKMDLDADQVRDYWKKCGPKNSDIKIASHALHAMQVAGLLMTEVEALNTPVFQYTWESERPRLRKLFEIHGPSLGHPQVLVNRAHLSLRGDNRITCRCAVAQQKQDHICDHVAHAFLFGGDNEIARLVHLKNGDIKSASIPIGLGFYWISIRVGRAEDTDTGKDTPFLLVSSGLEQALFKKMGIVPEDNFFILQENEGLISYILHLEDLLTITDSYQAQINCNPDDILRHSHCKLVHRDVVKSVILKWTAVNNPHREAWIMANSASIHETDVCLGCRISGVGANDTPQFD